MSLLVSIYKYVKFSLNKNITEPKYLTLGKNNTNIVFANLSGNKTNPWMSRLTVQSSSGATGSTALRPSTYYIVLPW